MWFFFPWRFTSASRWPSSFFQRDIIRPGEKKGRQVLCCHFLFLLAVVIGKPRMPRKSSKSGEGFSPTGPPEFSQASLLWQTKIRASHVQSRSPVHRGRSGGRGVDSGAGGLYVVGVACIQVFLGLLFRLQVPRFRISLPPQAQKHKTLNPKPKDPACLEDSRVVFHYTSDARHAACSFLRFL